MVLFAATALIFFVIFNAGAREPAFARNAPSKTKGSPPKKGTSTKHSAGPPRPPPPAAPPPPPAPPPPMRPCKIYVMDPSEELAPSLGLPACDLKKAWPFDAPGTGVDGLDATPHWAARHASGHWVAEAIRASPYHTDNIKEADLWYVNTHCYALWHESLWHAAQRDPSAPPFNPFNDISAIISRLVVEGVMGMKYFTRTAGRKIVISRPTAGSPPGGLMDTCARLKRSFILASERAVFCDNDRNRAAKGDSLIVPLVVVEGINATAPTLKGKDRTTFLYYKSRCPVNVDALEGGAAAVGVGGGSAAEAAIAAEELKHGASLAGVPSMLGQRFISAMHTELGGAAERGSPDVDVSCLSGEYPAQKEVLEAMQKSVFCPIMASGSQATRALPAAALSGCIPVFFGAPFSALPFAGEVDYPGIALFFNITDSGREPAPVGEEEKLRPRPPGDLEPNLGLGPAGIIKVASFVAALEALRKIPAEQIAAMQERLEHERWKLYYPPAPGKKESAAGRIIVNHMCEYSTRLEATIAAAQADRAERLDKLPKLHEVVKPTA